jgi:hypothetical protein
MVLAEQAFRLPAVAFGRTRQIDIIQVVACARLRAFLALACALLISALCALIVRAARMFGATSAGTSCRR